jgi:hypothetical protein
MMMHSRLVESKPLTSWLPSSSWTLQHV